MTIARPHTWIDIRSSALRHNAKALASVAQNTPLLFVVKSNAYGHGMVPVARCISKYRHLWGIGVANGEEALVLRRGGINTRIVVMSYCDESDLARCIKQRVHLPVYSQAQAKRYSSIGTRYSRTVNVHVKIDVGTTRVGISTDEFTALYRLCATLPSLRVVGVFSHLADSESRTSTFTTTQLHAFEKATNPVCDHRVFRHIACTAAAIRYARSRYSLCRIGIGLYGYWPSRDTRRYCMRHRLPVTLKPVLAWKAKLLQVKVVAKGTNVGYGRACTTTRKTTVGVVPVGYWEGYPRAASNRGAMLVHGTRCAILGRVCMNLTMIDCTDVPNARAGDTVTMIGGENGECVTADDVAGWSKTISYEILAGLHPLIPRYII